MSGIRYLLLALSMVGCLAAHAPPRAVTKDLAAAPQFPSAAEVGRIASSPAPARIANVGMREAESFTLVDTPQVSLVDAVHAPASPWEEMLSAAAQARPGQLWASESMHCLARQYGQFYLAHEGMPSADLGAFMAARCAVTDTEVSSFATGGAGIGPMPEQEIFAHTRGDLDDLIQKQLMSGNQAAGVWFGRLRDRVVAMLVWSPRRIRIESVPYVPGADGHVQLRGEVLVPGEHVEALINWGRFGVKSCAVLARARFPRFEIDCETQRSDAAAALEIAVFGAEKLVGRIMSHLVVWPAGNVGNEYVRSSYGVEMRAAPGADIPSSLTSLLNGVRAAAGMPSVELNQAESATAAAVAPHFFAAVAGAESEDVADTVSLGLRAGWHVPGLVGYGQFTSSMMAADGDAAGLLVAALDRPSGRQALLDPGARVIAIGAVRSAADGVMGAVFSSYSFVERAAPAEEADEAYRLLSALRQEKGLPAPLIARNFRAPAADAARRLELGQRTPEEALGDALESGGVGLGMIHGWLLTTDKMERLTFPAPLLAMPSVLLAFGVAHYKPPNSPWTLRAVIVLATSKLLASRIGQCCEHGRADGQGNAAVRRVSTHERDVARASRAYPTIGISGRTPD